MSRRPRSLQSPEKRTNVRLIGRARGGIRGLRHRSRDAVATWLRTRTQRALAVVDAAGMRPTGPESGPDVVVADALDAYRVAVTGDGTPLLIRPLTDADRGLVLELFESSSPESRYNRFLRPMPVLSAAMLELLSHPDGNTHLAWLAFEPDGDALRCVGVARLAREDEVSDRWDFSVTVRDSDHGRGIGSVLTALIGAEAARRGIGHVHGHVAVGNEPMVAILRRRGASFALDYPGVYRFRLPALDMAAAPLARGAEQPLAAIP